MLTVFEFIDGDAFVMCHVKKGLKLMMLVLFRDIDRVRNCGEWMKVNKMVLLIGIIQVLLMKVNKIELPFLGVLTNLLFDINVCTCTSSKKIILIYDLMIISYIYMCIAFKNIIRYEIRNFVFK